MKPTFKASNIGQSMALLRKKKIPVLCAALAVLSFIHIIQDSPSSNTTNISTKTSVFSHSKRKVVSLPNVLVIGSQKAGTSAIAAFLFMHRFRRPIYFKDELEYFSKEVHYFDHEDRYAQGIHFYAKRFPYADELDYLDATPNTFFYPERVRKTYNEAGGNQAETVRLIVLLREPISRELSLYNHMAHDYKVLGLVDDFTRDILKEDNSMMSFDQFVEKVTIPTLQKEFGHQSSRSGLYARYLEKWFQYFDRTQILVLSYDELQTDTEKIKERVEAFLQTSVEGKFKQSNELSGSDFTKLSLPSCNAKTKLQTTIFNIENEKLYKLLESHPGPPMEQRPFPRFKDPSCTD